MPPEASTTARAGKRSAGPPSRGRATMPVDAAGPVRQALADIAFDQADRRRLADRGDQRRHDRGAGHVAAAHGRRGARNGPPRATWRGGRRGRGRRARRSRGGRGCGAARRRPSGARSSRRRCRRRRRWCRRDASRPSRLGHGGGDAALRPGGGGALPDRRGGEHRDRTRRKAERGEQAGKAAADNDDVVGEQLRRRGSRSIRHSKRPL